jgi:hypothetical protein
MMARINSSAFSLLESLAGFHHACMHVCSTVTGSIICINKDILTWRRGGIASACPAYVQLMHRRKVDTLPPLKKLPSGRKIESRKDVGRW